MPNLCTVAEQPIHALEVSQVSSAADHLASAMSLISATVLPRPFPLRPSKTTFVASRVSTVTDAFFGLLLNV
jgi:hypothetical protein